MVRYINENKQSIDIATKEPNKRREGIKPGIYPKPYSVQYNCLVS